MKSSDDWRGLSAVLGAPRLLLLLTALIAGLGLFGLSKLRNEEDILVFLPDSEPEVATFKEAAKRFGAMRVALIGAKPRGQVDLFSRDVLERIGRLSESLKNSEGVDRVISLSTMTDLRPSDGGVDIRPLLPSPLPTDAAELARIKAHALELEHVRGNVISADGRSALILLFMAEGAKTQPLASRARELANAELGPVADLYFGGAPFAGQAIYDDTQHDVRRLTPLALVLFLLIVLLAFRGWLPVVLTVATVALAGIMVLGGMGLYGEAFSVVTGTLPLILFASGSQYAIHILGRYQLVRDEQIASGLASDLKARLQAAVTAVRIAGPPVTVAAINCCLGFLSFGVMNIRSMRTFGYACSFGVIFCMLFAVTVLPAAVARWEKGAITQGEQARFGGLSRLLMRQFRWARRRRGLVITVAALLSVAFAGGMTRVQVRMEPSAFFRPGSEPDLAQRFLDREFGGAQFAQVLIEGDLIDPRALFEVRRLASFARSLPGVTQIQSVVEPLALVSEAMVGLRGIPPVRAQVSTLLFFTEGEPSLRMLLTADRSAALVHIRLLGDARPIVARLDQYLKSRGTLTLHRPTSDELAEELGWMLPEAERPARRANILAAISQVQSTGLNLGGPAPEAKKSEAGGDDDQDDLDKAELARMQAAQQAASELLIRALGLIGPRREELRSQIGLLAAALLQPPEEKPTASATAGQPTTPPTLKARLTGEPMLDRGFSRAVERNQWTSLGVALFAVLIALLIAQRSLGAAVLSLLPAVMALLVVFGALGLTGKPIDLGTSLVGSIVTSSGADFAMHYIWYLRRRPPSEVVPTVGPVIFTTAALLALGMGVMMLGAAPPIRLFGGLACAGMLLAAAFTFLLVPALLPLPPEETLTTRAPQGAQKEFV